MPFPTTRKVLFLGPESKKMSKKKQKWANTAGEAKAKSCQHIHKYISVTSIIHQAPDKR